MTQFEFYKSFQFMIELLVAEGLFSLHLARRSKFPLRLILCLAVLFTLSYFFPILSDNAFYISFTFLALFAYTVLMAKVLFRESWFKILFCFIAGYTVQHFAYELYNLILLIMGVKGGSNMYGSGDFQLFPNPFIGIIYFFAYFIVYFFAELIFGNKIKPGEQFKINRTIIFAFVGLLLITDVILNAVVVFYFADETRAGYLIVVGIYNILCCLIALFLQFEVSLRQSIEDTLKTVNLLRHKEKEQYETSKKTIEVINMRCHDLKHQIRTIGANSTVNEKSIKEIENLISIYDAGIKTGNEVLDVILTEKNLLCAQTGIKFSCIADGKRLDFMSEEDIYSLFGNLIDNAIEAVQDLEKGKRVIGLKIRAVNDLLSINVNNYYEKTLEFEESGMPKTTKSEKEFHGYGLKSVKSICERYDGDLSINTENNVFNIKIMFSLDEI